MKKLKTQITLFIFQTKKENWSCTPHTSNTGRTAACHIFRERAGPSRYAKTQCDTALDLLKSFFQNYVLENVCDMTNVQGLLAYKNLDCCKPDAFEKFLSEVIIGVYKSNNENISQLLEYKR